MGCAIGVQFGNDSQAAIAEIRRLEQMANALSAVTGLATMIDIFARNGPIGTSYKVASTDFSLMASAMKASSPILVRRVEDIAMRAAMKPGLTYEETQFWRCLYPEL